MGKHQPLVITNISIVYEVLVWYCCPEKEERIQRNRAKMHLPSDIPLTKTVSARMKIIRDVLPSIAITFLTKCCPTSAAAVATATK